PAAIRARAGHSFLLIPTWRSVAVGFSECAGRVPHGTVELHEPGWFLFDGSGPIEHGRRPGGDPVKLRFRRRMLPAVLLPLAALLGGSNDPKVARTTKEVTIEPGVYEVDHPELFELAKVESRELSDVLNANGSVAPDVTRTIHVTSLGSGRVVELKARLGDRVTKGQVLLV